MSCRRLEFRQRCGLCLGHELRHPNQDVVRAFVRGTVGERRWAGAGIQQTQSVPQNKISFFWLAGAPETPKHIPKKGSATLGSGKMIKMFFLKKKMPKDCLAPLASLGPPLDSGQTQVSALCPKWGVAVIQLARSL